MTTVQYPYPHQPPGYAPEQVPQSAYPSYPAYAPYAQTIHPAQAPGSLPPFVQPVRGTPSPGTLGRVREGRSPALALVLSMLFPGLGQLYNRDYARGVFLLSLAAYLVALSALWLVTRFVPRGYGVILVVPVVLVWLYGMYDAYAQAKADPWHLQAASPPA